jgi:hypothetical protein
MPISDICLMALWIMGTLAMGRSCFATEWVRGLMRVPDPPESIRPFMTSS